MGATILFACVLSAVLASAVPGAVSAPDWARPDAMAIRRVGPLPDVNSNPGALGNFDCSTITYREVGSDTMRQGCFTETAFGMMNNGGGAVIFNGTDEGLPLEPYTPTQTLTPWPKAMDVISFALMPTGGAQIGLYKNLLASVDNNVSAYGEPIKKLDVPPDITLKDSSGTPLLVNPQTAAFSAGGSWMVVETLTGAFVRINLSDLSVMAFAPAYGSPGGPPSHTSYEAVTEDGNFVATYNREAFDLRVYDLRHCNGKADGLKPQACEYHDYMNFAEQHINGLKNVVRLRFINGGLLSFVAGTGSATDSGMYELAPAGSITALTNYVGLGDSYTSGEGAFDYLAGTDTADNMCHLSRHSYPLLLAQDLFGDSGGHSVACSGAVLKDIGSTSPDYRGQARGVGSLQQLQSSESSLLESIESGFMPGYVAQQRFIRRWQPSMATVSVGGNDIGFGDILRKCVAPHISRHLSDNTCYSTYEDRLEVSRLIDRTLPRLTALYSQLHSEAPETRLYAIGYPQIAADKGNCALNVQLGKSELEFAASLIDYLDATIKKAAGAAGINYIDISQALAGHRLCEAKEYDVAVNGLTAGTDAGILGIKVMGKESYHPNALGYFLIEQAILKQTHNFSDALPVVDDTATAPAGPAGFLDAPKTGRPVYTLVPDDHLTPGAGRRGLNTSIQVESAALGLKPGPNQIHLDGPSGPIIGSVTAGGSADITNSVQIPNDTDIGEHTIDLTGESEDGKPMDVTQSFYVSGGGADSDGDSIDDVIDTCPAAINSGQDQDGDGTDDICDPIIGAPGSGSSPSGKSTGTTAAPGPAQESAHRIVHMDGHVLGDMTSPDIAQGTKFKSAPGRKSQDSSKNHGENRPEHIYFTFWSALLISMAGVTVPVTRKFIKKKGFQLQ
jgi:hypothetical protein